MRGIVCFFRFFIEKHVYSIKIHDSGDNDDEPSNFEVAHFKKKTISHCLRIQVDVKFSSNLVWRLPEMGYPQFSSIYRWFFHQVSIWCISNFRSGWPGWGLSQLMRPWSMTTRNGQTSSNTLLVIGFNPFWKKKLKVNWDYYSKYMEKKWWQPNYQPE